MASIVYNSYVRKILAGGVNLETATLRMALVTAAYTPDKDGHSNFTDITNEVTGTGYTAGGIQITQAASFDAEQNTAELGLNDATFRTVDGFTASGAVIYEAAGDQDLVAFMDFSSDIIANGRDLVVRTQTPLRIVNQ